MAMAFDVEQMAYSLETYLEGTLERPDLQSWEEHLCFRLSYIYFAFHFFSIWSRIIGQGKIRLLVLVIQIDTIR